MTEKKRILLAEDDRDLRTMTELLLRRAGYDVLGAEDGQEAWEKLQTEHVDLIVLDIMMPRMDGLEVARRVREDPVRNSTWIVFLTALDTDQDVLRGYELGAVQYVTKPFEGSFLLGVVEETLNRY